MSKKHPIIAVTGSSGAGTTSTSQAFRKIFHQLNIRLQPLKGIVFIVIPAQKWIWQSVKPVNKVAILVIFGSEANDFALLEQTLIDYAKTGQGQSRKYLQYL
ncbi:Phosphoribulokinase 1 [Providencia rustigianii]|nr:Phosphoribulokinase 1 [Providencia rustigianii]